MSYERPFLETESVIQDVLGDIGGLTLVDIGAGSGRVARKLQALGAQVTGIEPNPIFVQKAEAQGGVTRFVNAPAEETGLDDGEFDVAFFSLSLHHAAHKKAAVDEACRLTRAGGRVLVIEPVAPDPSYPVMRFLDDESAVYAEAQAALNEASSSGLIEHIRTLNFASKYRVETPDDMIADVLSVDSRRPPLAEAERPAFEAAFFAAHERDQDGGYLPYWSRADLFLRI